MNADRVRLSWSRGVHLGIGFAAPSKFVMMLRLMQAVTFDIFGTLDSA